MKKKETPKYIDTSIPIRKTNLFYTSLVISPRFEHNVDKYVRYVNIVNVKGYLQKHRFNAIRNRKKHK